MASARTFRVEELASHVSGRVFGDGSVEIAGLETLEFARPGDLTFIGEEKYAGQWASSRASAAVISEGLRAHLDGSDSRPLIEVAAADLAMASILTLFAPDEPAREPGISADAQVHPTAQVDPSATVAPGSTIGAETTIGPHTRIDSGVHIGHSCVIGADCHFRPGAIVEHHVIIGSRVILHPNAIIGGDGFGYRADEAGELVKIPHIGIVEIGDDAEVGPGSTVDRAKFGRTDIGKGTRIDDLVHIAHNVRVGRNCVIAGHAAIAGSVTIGDWCRIGGQVGIADHIRIGDRVQIAAQAGVFRDIESDSVVAGAPTMPIREFWRLQAALRKLPAALRAGKGRLR